MTERNRGPARTATADRATAAVFAGVVALTMGAYHHNATFGYAEAAAADAFRAVGLSAFLIFFGHGWRVLAAGARRGPRWLRSDGALSLIGFSVLCAAGAAAPFLPWSPLPLLALFGLASAAVAVHAAFRRASPWRVGLFLVFSMLFAVRMAWFVLTLLEQKLIQAGLHRDPLFHSAVASMIQTYGVPSTGVDGVVYFPYHFASHWVAAQIANLTGGTLLHVYEATLRIVAIPFFLHTLLGFILTLRRQVYPRENHGAPPLRADLLLGLLLFLGLMGAHHGLGASVLPDFGSSMLGSESFVLAQACGYATATLTIVFFRTRLRVAPAATTPFGWRATDHLFAWFVLPLLLGLLGLLKISVAALAMPLLGYAVLRYGLYRLLTVDISAIASLGVMAGVVVATRMWHSNPSRLTVEPVAGFVTELLAAPWQATAGMLAYILLPVVFVASRLRRLGLATLRDVSVALRNGRIVDVELMVLASLVGFAPATLARVGGGGQIYFTLVPITVAVALLCASRGLPFEAVPAVARATRQGRLAGILGTLAAAAFLSLAAREAWQPASGRPGVMGKVAATLFITPLECLQQDCTAARREEQRRLVAARPAGYQALALMRSLSELPRDEKRQSLLFVPRTTDAYWRLSPEPQSSMPCLVQPFIAPAIAGLAMLDGRPEGGCPGVHVGAYQLLGLPRVADTSDGGLCRAAARRGFANVFVMDSAPDGMPSIRKVSCAGASAARGAP